MQESLDLSQLAARIGERFDSDWSEISQARIDAFAELTGDHQYIHVDPARAALTPFGGTIAHGYLTLSLLAMQAEQALSPIRGVVMGMNYGFDKIRFLAPVRAGKRVRAQFTLAEVVEHAAGATTAVQPGAPRQWRLRWQVTVEIEGESKPALVADWLTLLVV